MRTWAWMTGGLILWAAHFMGLYALASAADVVSTADDPAWRMGGLAFSVVCVALAAVLLLLAFAYPLAVPILAIRCRHTHKHAKQHRYE